ncbi:hypothetical protein AKJ16_DCAP08457 [Drosera capensis]
METAKPQHVKKGKKKPVKDAFDSLKQAEKERRRLEKALAASAAIRSELEKKKQMKKEEQERLGEEGAAIAKAVALQVLIGEDSLDSSEHAVNGDPESFKEVSTPTTTAGTRPGMRFRIASYGPGAHAIPFDLHNGSI